MNAKLSRLLIVAGILSITGQVTAITFMLAPNPFTTFAFMTAGAAMILMAMALFAFVMFKDIRARTDSVTEKRFEAGEYIFRQGEPGDRVYVVKSGEVEVIREDPAAGQRILARLGSGEYFGEMALLSSAPRNASVVAATDVTALVISHHGFEALFSVIPALRQSIDAVVKTRA